MMKHAVAGALVLLSMLAPAGGARADEPVSEDARRHFKAGVALLQDPDGARYEEAYREFKTAYEMSPTPKMLGNVAYCAMKLERDDEAIVAYERYLREASDIEPSERSQVEADLMTLKSGVVRVTLRLELPGGMIVDRRVPTRGEAVTNSYGPSGAAIALGLRPGRHVLEVKLEGGAAEPWIFEAMPGTTLSHAFVRVRPVSTAAPAPSKFWPIATMSLGGAVLAGGGVTGFLALTGQKKITRDCPNNVCPEGYGLASQRDSVNRLARVSDVLFIGGGAVTVSGFVWLLLSRRGSPSTTTGSLLPGAVCTGAGCEASLAGTF